MDQENEINVAETSQNQDFQATLLVDEEDPLSVERDPNIIHLPEPEEPSKEIKPIYVEKISNNRRLMIDQIVLENFKSYYGIKKIGPFHKSFTSIVGPNGSGKSNLIESLLFIFGKRARWMRLNKLSELIHNSAKHPSCSKASVEVKFFEIIDKDDVNNFDVIEDSRFSVKRTVFQAGNSRYEINGEDSTQAEVITLLKSKGIDLTNNRFLILQGEVEQISLMKPKTNDPADPGMLEYLEDIIGSNQYKEQIDNLEMELDKCVDVKLEKLERLRISEHDLYKIQDAKNYAVDFVKKEKQAYQLANIENQLDKNKNYEETKAAETALIEIDTKLKAARKKKKDKEKENETFVTNFAELKKEIEANEKAKVDCQRKYEDLNIKDAKVQNDKKHQLANENKFQQSLDILENQYQNIIETTAEIERELPDKERLLNEITKEKGREEDKLNVMLFNLRGSTEMLRKEKESIEKELAPHSIKQNEIRNKIDEYANEMALIERLKRSAETEATELAMKVQELTNTLKEHDTYSSQIDQAMEKITEISKITKKQLKDLKDIEDARMNELHEVNSKLEEYKQNSNDSKIQSSIVVELMKAQKKSELTGICGRLGDLGVIEREYDIAISTACPQLDFIVVNKYDEAQKCVEYLRKNKIGRATFLALDKIEGIKQQMSAKFQAPNGSKRLFDLVNPNDPKYSTAFYHALRDTLFCNDIDQATFIAYGQVRYRVVTRRGELIDISGVMSGGGRPKSGAMGSKKTEEIDEDKIREYMLKSQELIEKIEEARRQKLELEKKMQEVSKDEVQAKKEKQRITMEIDFDAQQLQENAKKLEDLDRFLKNKTKEEKRSQELDQLIREYDDKLLKINDVVQKYREKIKELDDAISEIGGRELKNQQIRVQEIGIRHEHLDNEVSKMQAQVANVIKNLNKNKREQVEVKEKLEKTRKILERIREEEKNLEDEGMKVLAVMRGTDDKKEELEKKFNEFDKENEKIKKMMSELKTEIDMLSAEKDDKSKILKKSRDAYNEAVKNIDTLRKKYNEILDNYDFMDLIDEIHSSNIQAPKKVKNVEENEDSGDEYLGSPQDSTQANEIQTRSSRIKKVKVNFDAELVYSISPFDDMNVLHIERIEPYYHDIKLKHAQIAEKLKDVQPNINSIKEYKEKYDEHKIKMRELAEVKDMVVKAKLEIDELKRKRFSEFMRGFTVISSKLKEVYQVLTGGGDAELELVDSLDPFSEGVTFSVRPPKKSWKQMSKLSGGEKTLSSLALVFALHYFKPTPLYFMDEIDAALDYKNVAIVGNYIKEKTKNAQFIIISLRNKMFELADKLVGVYKTQDSTKTVTIHPCIVSQMVSESLIPEILEQPS